MTANLFRKIVYIMFPMCNSVSCVISAGEAGFHSKSFATDYLCILVFSMHVLLTKMQACKSSSSKANTSSLLSQRIQC